MTAASFPIRTITPDEFDAWHHSVMAAFHGTSTPEWRDIHRMLTEPPRTLAAFDRKQIVGTSGAFTFRMCVPGGLRPVAGVTAVTVAPTHRRQGVLRAMMARQLGDIADRGEPVAALFASESSIYRRFGYGCAARDLSFELRRGEGAFAPGTPSDEKLRIRLATPGDTRKELAAVFDEQLPSRPGFFARADAWWDKLLQDPEHRRAGAGPLQCALAEDGNGPRAYALFSITARFGGDMLPDHCLDIRELLASDPAAYAAIWRHLLERDLVSSIVAYGRPFDEPLLHLLADPRRARPRLTDNLWVRIVDLGAALTQRTYARPVDIVLEVEDEFCPWNAGRWRLSGDLDGATCERTSAAADVALSARNLGAAYLGAGQLGAAAASAQVRELRPGSLRVLSTAMSWDPQPWCPLIF